MQQDELIEEILTTAEQIAAATHADGEQVTRTDQRWRLLCAIERSKYCPSISDLARQLRISKQRAHELITVAARCGRSQIRRATVARMQYCCIGHRLQSTVMSTFFMSFRGLATLAAGVAVLVAAGVILAQSTARGPTTLDAARYTASGELEFPANTDEWVAVGAGIGGDYGEEAFDPSNPGTITMVRIEPSAYRFLRDNGRYADGTMLLLTFYQTQQKPEPQLRGFVQGDVDTREIHVIDRTRFAEEGRAFFVFPGTQSVAAKMPVGSECVVCHTEHGTLDGTFAQFYPPVRPLARAD